MSRRSSGSSPLSFAPLRRAGLVRAGLVRAGLVSLGVLASTLACQNKKEALSPEKALSFAPKTSTEDDAESPTSALPLEFPGQLMAEVEPGSFGPHLVRGRGGWVAVWETPSGATRGWYSSFWPDGAPPEAPLRLLDPSKNLLRVHATAATRGEVVVLSLRRGGKHSLLEIMRLGGQGELLAAPRTVADSPASILWIEAVPTQSGTLCVWAEQTGPTAQLFAVAVSNEGAGRPVKLVDQAHAWQLASHAGSIALATLEGGAQKSIRLRLLGERGEVLKAPLTLSEGAVQGGYDLDLALSDRRIVAAWTERRGLETRLVGSLLDAQGTLRKRAVELTVPRGNQALSRLVSDPGRDEMLLVWDETNRSGAGNELLLGHLVGDQPAEVEARLAVDAKDQLLPQFALRDQRLALLVQMTLCDESEKCRSARTTLLSPDSKTAPGAADLRSSSAPGGPSMLWDLSCIESGCVALAADGSNPTRVYGIDVTEGGPLPSPLLPDDAAVRIESLRAVVEVPELSAISGAKNPQGREVIAWLSYFDPSAPYVIPNQPAPDGRKAPVRARLETFLTKKDVNDVPPISEQVISYRARSLGGVATVAPSGHGLLAWAALDGTEPQLFATLINDAGTKLRQKMLTQTAGEVTDVAAVRTEQGYLIAWVDARGASPEVWALTVDEQLQSAGAVQVTSGARNPSGVSLLADGGEILAVWADARGTTEAGAASDLFATRLDTKTGRPLGVERRIVSTLSHCHSPKLRRLGEGVVLAWVETRPGGSQGSGDFSAGKLMWANWDEEASKLQGHEASGLRGAAAFSVFCRARICGALVAAHGADGGTDLWFSTYDGVGAPRASHLETLRSNSPIASTPLLLDDVAFVTERGSDQKWLVSRLAIDW